MIDDLRSLWMYIIAYMSFCPILSSLIIVVAFDGQGEGRKRGIA